MEYKIFKYLRNNKIISIPIILRLFFGVFLILLSVIPIVLPIFPGSLFLGLIILVVGLLSIVPGRKIRLVIKIRKGITYLFQNIHNKQIIKHKIYDIKNHILEIIDEEDEFNK